MLWIPIRFFLLSSVYTQQTALHLCDYLFNVFDLLYDMFWATFPSSDIITTNLILVTYFEIYATCNAICQFQDVIKII